MQYRRHNRCSEPLSLPAGRLYISVVEQRFPVFLIGKVDTKWPSTKARPPGRAMYLS